MFLKIKNIIFKIRRSKVTDYAALIGNIKCYHKTVFTVCLFKQTKQNKSVAKNYESL